MRRNGVIAWLVAAMFSLLYLFTAAAQDVYLFVDCVEQPTDQHGFVVWFGYSADATYDGLTGGIVPFPGPGTGTVGFLSYPPTALAEGEFHNVFAVEIMDVRNAAVEWFMYDAAHSFSMYFDPHQDNAPDCGEVQDHLGDAPSIPIELTSDCAFVEVKDYFQGEFTGHWSRVTSDGEDVLLHYGEPLIAGRNQSLDPADYRAVETACF